MGQFFGHKTFGLCAFPGPGVEVHVLFGVEVYVLFLALILSRPLHGVPPWGAPPTEAAGSPGTCRSVSSCVFSGFAPAFLSRRLQHSAMNPTRGSCPNSESSSASRTAWRIREHHSEQNILKRQGPILLSWALLSKNKNPSTTSNKLEFLTFRTLEISVEYHSKRLHLKYFDVMHMKFLREIVPPEFSDVVMA